MADGASELALNDISLQESFNSWRTMKSFGRDGKDLLIRHILLKDPLSRFYLEIIKTAGKFSSGD